MNLTELKTKYPAVYEEAVEVGKSIALLAEGSAVGRPTISMGSTPAPGAEVVIDANLPIEEQAKIAWDKSPELRNEFGGAFDRYLAFEKHKDSVRIVGRKA